MVFIASDVKILIGLPVKTTKIPVTISEEKLSYNFPGNFIIVIIIPLI